jgi:hypothetical protein
VSSSPQEKPAPDRVTIDPERIRHLTAFANGRRKSTKPMDTMPAPRMTAMFYDDANYLGSIGAGPSFFFVACSNWKGTRNATDAEINDIKRLIGDN